MTEPPDAAFLARMEALGPAPGAVTRDDLLRLLRLAGDTTSFVYRSVEGLPRGPVDVEAEGFRGLLEEARAATGQTADGGDEEAPCPVCGNEVRGQGGYLNCECPAPPKLG